MHPQLHAVWGTTRDPDRIEEIAALGVTPLLFDGSTLSPLAGERRRGGKDTAAAFIFPPSLTLPRKGGGNPPFDADHILVSIPPDDAGDPVLKHFADDIAAARPKAIVYLSTVGVYGDHGGAWVDETSECRPVSKRSRERVAAEDAWRHFADDISAPLAIIRLAGIYGPGRGPFEKIRRGTARRIVKPGQVFNRIHVEDIAQIVNAAFTHRANGVFNGTDDEPAPPQDVLAYAAALLGLPPPPEAPFESADLSEMARSFYGESKRVRNDKIKRELGVRLVFPTYREGLQAILEMASLGVAKRPFPLS